MPARRNCASVPAQLPSHHFPHPPTPTAEEDFTYGAFDIVAWNNGNGLDEEEEYNREAAEAAEAAQFVEAASFGEEDRGGATSGGEGWHSKPVSESHCGDDERGVS